MVSGGLRDVVTDVVLIDVAVTEIMQLLIGDFNLL